MPEIDIILFLIITISVAGFAIQTSVSALADKVRRILFLDEDKIKPLTRYKFYVKILGVKTAYALFFVIIPIVIIMRIWSLIAEASVCPYCVGFWYMFAANLLLFDMQVLYALVLAPFVLLFITIFDRLLR